MPLILALGRYKQADLQVQGLVYIVNCSPAKVIERPCLKHKLKQRWFEIWIPSCSSLFKWLGANSDCQEQDQWHLGLLPALEVRQTWDCGFACSPASLGAERQRGELGRSLDCTETGQDYRKWGQASIPAHWACPSEFGPSGPPKERTHPERGERNLRLKRVMVSYHGPDKL